MKKDGDEAASLKKRIRELEEENQSLNKIIQTAPIPIFVLDRDHRITHFNRALEELSGFSSREMIGTDTQWKAFYAKKRPVMADLILNRSSDDEILAHYGLKYNKSMAGKGLFAATDFFPDLGPEGRWLYFTAAAVTNSRGEIAGAVETLQDVTEEKIKEKQVTELYRIYRQILEFVPYPIVVYDDHGLVSYVNPAFSKTFGWALDELSGKPLPFVPEDLMQETYDMLNRFRENRKLTRYETRRLTKEGGILDVVIWAVSHSGDKESSAQNFVILRDITEEKRLQANNRTIMRISAALPEYPELEDLMDYITREVKELVTAEGAVVLLHDEIKGDLFFLGASYDDAGTEKRARKIRFAPDEVLAGKVLKTGEPAMVNNADATLKVYPERDRKLGYETRSILCVPIKSDSRIIGVLCAINKKLSLFNDKDRELMTMIAGTVAISIENAWFSDALKDAYRDVASMNRAKGKAINHLSHELKTPVAVLTGSLQILRKKISALPGAALESTLNRIERNLGRIVEIQEETSDIMENKGYSARAMLVKMLETCQDELETLIEHHLVSACHDPKAANPAPGLPLDQVLDRIRKIIDQEFGPRAMTYKNIDFKKTLDELLEIMGREFHFRNLEIRIHTDAPLPELVFPKDVLKKIMAGLIKNSVENTPDLGRIEIRAENRKNGILFRIHDFGVGIEEEDQKRIFEGFFSTQETLFYSTKTPYEFNAGGKGMELLRMKLFSERLGFTLNMESKRCIYLMENPDEECPGDISRCRFCKSQKDCLDSGHSIFSVFFPMEDSGERKG
ncbi:PAS domain-containing protein [Desulfospira joergensenii]|uniref:PAS domain-containing protein n=1 Tax=Desulfospira joergensenii TaxID=53329 RepID=UPI0003B49D0A|nr:PAS domain S-box protein [Desulfospira joergensenii]